MAKRYSYCIYHETLFIYTVTTTFFSIFILLFGFQVTVICGGIRILLVSIRKKSNAPCTKPIENTYNLVLQYKTPNISNRFLLTFLFFMVVVADPQ